MSNSGNTARTTYDDVSNHFNNMADKYDLGSKKVEWRGPQALFSALKIIYGADEGLQQDQRPLKILDLGTGTGMIGQLFKGHFENVHITGVDIALEMLEKAKANNRIDLTVHGSVTDLSWSKDDQYDVVTSSGVMDFIEDSAAFVAEATRVVKPGGIIAVTFEPEGTHFSGHKTLQHDPDRLKYLFKRHGAGEVTLEGALKGAYRNFADSHKPVENHLLVVSKDINFNI